MTKTKPTLTICVPLYLPPWIKGNRRRNWRVVANELANLVARRDDIEVIAIEYGGNHTDEFPWLKRIEISEMGPFNRSQSMNAGWRAAQADLICFLDADIIMRPEDWDKAIEEAQQYDCYSPNRQYLKLPPNKTAYRIHDGKWDWGSPVNNGVGRRIKHQPTTFFGTISFAKRNWLESVNGWPEEFEGWGSEDQALEAIAKGGNASMMAGNLPFMHLYHQPANRRHLIKNREILNTFYKHRSLDEIMSIRSGTENPDGMFETIPKIFHHVWLGRNQMPEEQQRWMKDCKSLHPDWEFRLWDDENTSEIQDLISVCKGYSPASDVVRVWAVMNHGGVYADTDFEWYRAIDPLIEGVDAFCAKEDEKHLNCALFGATSNHPWLKQLWRFLPDYISGKCPWGPRWFTNHTNRDSITIFPTKYFYPYHWKLRNTIAKSKNYPQSYCVHHWAKSWE